MTNTTNVPLCEIHRTPMTLKPAGVSKTTGKAYPPFWSCGQKNEDGSWCKYRPTEAPVPTKEQVFGAELDKIAQETSAQKEEGKKRTAINASVALKAAILYHQNTIRVSDEEVKEQYLKEALSTAQTFLAWLEEKTK